MSNPWDKGPGPLGLTASCDEGPGPLVMAVEADYRHTRVGKWATIS